MKVIFKRDDVDIAEANIKPERLAKAGVIQIVDQFFTFSRFDGGAVVFQSADILPLDDEEVNYEI